MHCDFLCAIFYIKGGVKLKNDFSQRIKKLRKQLELNQRDFSCKINIAQSTLAMFETGSREPKDIHISQICSVFNVNENWLRYGDGDMFIEPSTFSLDDYAKKKNLTEKEILLIREFMELDPSVRNALYNMFEKAFNLDTLKKEDDKKNSPSGYLTYEEAHRIYEECPKTPEELEALVIEEDNKNVC